MPSRRTFLTGICAMLSGCSQLATPEYTVGNVTIASGVAFERLELESVSDGLFTQPTIVVIVYLKSPEEGGRLPHRLEFAEESSSTESGAIAYRPPPSEDTEVTVSIDPPERAATYTIEAVDAGGDVFDSITFTIEREQ